MQIFNQESECGKTRRTITSGNRIEIDLIQPHRFDVPAADYQFRFQKEQKETMKEV